MRRGGSIICARTCRYRPVFWDDQKVYVEVAVEKLDLRNLFESACAEFYVPISNLIDCVRSMLTY